MPSQAIAPDAPRSPRIFRVHGSVYHHDEVMEAPQSHTDARLADVADAGFDGVWIHANLKWLAPTALFEAYVDDIAQRVDALRATIDRAAAHGMGVWLYLNEPRGLPADHPFWDEHPDCAGHHHDDNRWDLGWPWPFERQPCRCMCLSSDKPVAFLREGIETLLRATPKLAGVITITNSEHPTHCYSKAGRNNPTNCERCADRPRVDMPVTVLTAMHEGFTAAGTGAQLAAWTWSWNNLAPDPQPDILNKLPRDVALVVDFERGQPVERLGLQYEIDEYAFAITGPSQRFETYQQAAGDRDVWAKLQIGATHELATMPNIPAVAALRGKVKEMRKRGIPGALATWTMGQRPTVNSFAAGRLLAAKGELPSLEDLAMDYFNVDMSAAAQVARAWELFSEAVSYFPTTMPMCYSSPVNYAPAFEWKLKREHTRMARSWTPEPWGDHLEQSLKGMTLADVAALLERLDTIWQRGFEIYDAALRPVGSERAKQELNVAEACGLFYMSTAGVYRFTDFVEQGAGLDELAPLIEHEIAVCERAAELLDADDRLGYHDDFGYMITPALIHEKVEKLKALLQGMEA